MERWQNIHTNFVLNCIPKLWLLILPSSYYTFLCKLVMRIWWSIKVISCTWWVWVFSLPVCQIMFGHYREKATSKVVHAFVTTKLDYCSHLYFGLSKYQVNKMQRVQNKVAQLVTCSSKYDHITPLLQQLHWLPVLYCVVFKILRLVYKAHHGLCPGYVSEWWQEWKSSRVLCSSSLGLLATPTSRKKSYEDRAFSVCAPKLWNGLPNHVRNVGTLPLF